MRMAVRVVEASSGHGVGGVAVTCGDGIVLTDAGGACTLAPGAEDRWVWICRPQGWRTQGDFYRRLPATDDVLFELADEPASSGQGDGGRGARLVQFTDTHVVGPGSRVAAADLALDLAQVVAEAAPDLLIATGDMTNLGSPEELAELQAGLAQVTTPLFLMFGGHDGNFERRADDPVLPFTHNWEACFGPTYYSFDWGGRHVVVWPNEDTFFAPEERLRKRRWLEADLAASADAGTTLLVTHQPPPAAFVDELAALGVDWILHGHWHSTKVHRRSGVTVAAAPPLCFGGIDTTPRGYRVLAWGADTRRARTRVVVLGAAGLQPATPERLGDYRLSWTLDLKTAAPAWTRLSHRSAPAVSEHGLFLAASHATGGAVVALSHAGAPKWSTHLEAPVRNEVCPVAERVLALAMNGALYCLRAADGQVDWRADLDGYPDRWLYTSPVESDGVVYAGAKGGMGAYDTATGQRHWYADLESSDAWSCYASPCVAGELVVLLVPRRGLVALSRADGSLVWETPLPVEYQYAAPVLTGDHLLTGGQRQQLACLRWADGQVLWQRDGLQGAYPAGLASDGEQLYAATPAGCLQAFDVHTGVERWRLDTGADRLDMTPYERGIASILARPTRVGEHLLAGANDGVLRLVDPRTGTESARADFGVPLTAPPRAVDDGFLQATWDGRLLRYD